MSDGLGRPNRDRRTHPTPGFWRDKSTRRANQRSQRKPVQPSCKKYFAFAVGQISSTSSPRPFPARGALAIVTNAGWDAVDAAASGAKLVRRAASRREQTTARKMNDTSCVRQNRVVPTPVAGAKLCGGCVSSTELDQPLIHQRRRQDEFVSGESAP